MWENSGPTHRMSAVLATLTLIDVGESGPTHRMSAVLATLDIDHPLDDWNPTGERDWPYWHRQMWEYVGAHF